MRMFNILFADYFGVLHESFGVKLQNPFFCACFCFVKLDVLYGLSVTYKICETCMCSVLFQSVHFTSNMMR
jgi:hypothetical protein